MKRALHGWLTPWSIALTIYWMAMFVGTHIPRVPPIHGFEPSDKVLHFVAYFGLVVLLAIAWMTQNVLNWRHYSIIFAVGMAYGAVDEWLQIPVGRDCSLLDWYADVAGAFFGLVAYAIIVEIVGRRSFGRDKHGSADTASRHAELH